MRIIGGVIKWFVVASWQVSVLTWRQFRKLPPKGQLIVAGAFGVLMLIGALTSEGPERKERVALTNVEDQIPRATTTTERIRELQESATTEVPTTTAKPTTTLPPTTTTTAPPPPPPPPTTVAPRPLVSPTTSPPPPAQETSSGCHSSYTRTCIPPNVSDADCAGGSGNGPHYVHETNIGVVGPDVFELDGKDNDGIGCEGP